MHDVGHYLKSTIVNHCFSKNVNKPNEYNVKLGKEVIFKNTHFAAFKYLLNSFRTEASNKGKFLWNLLVTYCSYMWLASTNVNLLSVIWNIYWFQSWLLQVVLINHLKGMLLFIGMIHCKGLGMSFSEFLFNQLRIDPSSWHLQSVCERRIIFVREQKGKQVLTWYLTSVLLTSKC